jgi:hypothetical protein
VEKYSKLQSQILESPKQFDQSQILEINQKADKIIQSHSEKNTEYRIQTKPELKKGILKYHFKKPDEIVNSSLQNSTDITREQIEAFRDTSYDGTLNNHGKHYQFANFMDGKWVHDFYYAEGNIYAKLEQLEIDFKDRFSVGGTENQYEKQKELLLNVLPKPKTLDEIFISPNHEFVHQFDLGSVEKERGVVGFFLTNFTITYLLFSKNGLTTSDSFDSKIFALFSEEYGSCDSTKTFEVSNFSSSFLSFKNIFNASVFVNFSSKSLII